MNQAHAVTGDRADEQPGYGLGPAKMKTEPGPWQFSQLVTPTARRVYRSVDNADEVYTRIYWQCSALLSVIRMVRAKHRDILNAAESLTHRLTMVKYHLNRFHEIQDAVLRGIDVKPEAFDVPRVQLEYAELTAEYESFLMHFKSTLDYLVRLTACVHGGSLPHTFKDKGEHFLEALVRLHRLGKDGGRLAQLIAMLKEDLAKGFCYGMDTATPGEKGWMVPMIELRDGLMHYRPIERFTFQIDKGSDNKIGVIPPRMNMKTTIADTLDLQYDNLVHFCEDFVFALLGPFLEKPLVALTFRGFEGFRMVVPKWQIWLDGLPGDIRAHGVLQFMRILEIPPYSTSVPAELRSRLADIQNFYLYYLTRPAPSGGNV